MARSFLTLALLIPLFLLAPPQRLGAAPEKPSKKDGEPAKGDKSKEDGCDPFRQFQKKLEQMSPEERERMKENWKRWRKMGDRERHDWQRRTGEQRERIKKAIDDAISQAGLTLTDEERKVFVTRYRQERRAIEEQLRREMDVLREQRMAAVLAGLKTEFEARAATPTPSPRPSVAPSP